jgi:iron complex transport system ATP-binding protein
MKLEARELAYCYTSRRPVLTSVSLSIASGQTVFILGANGSGKTTLIQCVAGMRVPQGGSVLLDARPILRLSLRERARAVGVVPQIHEPVFDYTVGEVVLMGRAPQLRILARPGRRDWADVQSALERVDLLSLIDRPYTQVSGGERQLALIARGLAQGASCLLMDEPAAHLDPRFQHRILSTVRELATQGFAFAVTSHHPNNALLYGDRVVFLIDGRSDFPGAPSEVINERSLAAAYRFEFEIIRGPGGTRAVIPRLERPRRIRENSSGNLPQM